MIKFNFKNWSYLNILLAIIASLLFYLFAEFPTEYQSAKTVATIAILMSVLWMTEAIPISATSLIPLIMFPLTGTISGKQAAEAYMNSTIFLFLGGFIIAIAMEKWNLHKRIALNVINLFGSTPSLIILGFMIAAAFISMWIS
ncbi:MAG: SLC13 family permease, partial [Ignavibacteria bacterium]|nr:SLC13 family permease [Ignavibacteria bacterium]